MLESIKIGITLGYADIGEVTMALKKIKEIDLIMQATEYCDLIVFIGTTTYTEQLLEEIRGISEYISLYDSSGAQI